VTTEGRLSPHSRPPATALFFMCVPDRHRRTIANCRSFTIHLRSLESVKTRNPHFRDAEHIATPALSLG
jgi:hypothetical protein